MQLKESNPAVCIYEMILINHCCLFISSWSQSKHSFLTFSSSCFQLVMHCQEKHTEITDWLHTICWACLQWLTIDVKHHLPHCGAHRLVEAKPDFSPTTQWVVVSFRWGKKGTTHWSVPNGRTWGGVNENNELTEFRAWPQCDFMSSNNVSCRRF